MCDTNKRLGFIGILVEDLTSVEKVNETLSQYGTLIVGRMGIPYRDRGGRQDRFRARRRDAVAH